MKESVLHWVWLSCVCGAGSSYTEALLETYGDATKIYEANSAGECLDRHLDESLDYAKRIVDFCMRNKIGILTPEDKLFPKRLKQIRRAPAVLYYRGLMPDIDDNVCISMIGTRKMTAYGERIAYTSSYDLAKSGAIVVSGMAKGVDGQCHRGALDAGGHTIAVLGCGIDRVYPKEHYNLMKEIMYSGTVITEYPPATKPLARNFPIRNRIISGLSNGTVVVEAGKISGSLITARLALAQGRDLFAFPGEVGELNSTGTNELLKKGAKIVTEASDILEEYEFLYPHRIQIQPRYVYLNDQKKNLKPQQKQIMRPQEEIPAYEEIDNSFIREIKENTVNRFEEPFQKETMFEMPKDNILKENKEVPTLAKEQIKSEKRSVNIPDGLSEMEIVIWNAIGDGATVDQIASYGIDVSTVMVALTMFEIKGIVESRPGGIYVKKQ